MRSEGLRADTDDVVIYFPARARRLLVSIATAAIDREPLMRFPGPRMFQSIKPR